MTMLNKQRILIISSLLILIWMSVGIFVYHSSFLSSEEDTFLNPAAFTQEIVKCTATGEKLSTGFWRKIDLHKRKIPQIIKDSLKAIDVQSDSVNIQGVNVHYIHTKLKTPNGLPVLLLHGQAFSAETWNELGTIKVLSALGYNPIAVDLPGYGKTPKMSDIKDKVSFLDNLIKELNLKKPVLVSPSMSGSYSLPYLIEHSNRLGGFIPVSPVQTRVLSNSLCKDNDDPSVKQGSASNQDCQKVKQYLRSDHLKLSCIKVPSVIVWGEHDRAENSAKLCLLPESQGFEVPDGKHAAYISNPELWHQLLYNFLDTLNITQACV